MIKVINEAKIKVRALIKKYRRLIRFSIVGCINTGVDYGIFSLLVGVFGVDNYTSQIFAYTGGALNSFLMNKFWTFEDKEVSKKTANQFMQFAVINILSLSVTLLGLRIFVQEFAINKYIAKLLVTVLAQVVNFVGYKLWVFKKD